MQRFAKIFVLLIAFIATSLAVEAATWYVKSSTGSNTNSGADWANAFATITYAVGQAWPPQRNEVSAPDTQIPCCLRHNRRRV